MRQEKDSTKCVGTSVETALLDNCHSRESLNVTIGRAESGKFGKACTEEFTETMAALENPEGGALSFSVVT